MVELVMIGFADRHRAGEVFSQLQRLEFDWIADIHNGVAVEVESDGGLRMIRSQLIDPAAEADDAVEWEALLTAIVPISHPESSKAAKLTKQAAALNLQSIAWLKDLAFNQDFARDAAALLRPGNSAILATIRDWQAAIKLLSGYSHLVLHTTISWPRVKTP